jgi:glycosyltransferase involved in cell wall biosynthesis
MNGGYRYCFVMERQVGIGSAAGAVEPYLREQAHVWADVTYEKLDGILEKLPLPARVRGTLRGVVQTTSALRRGPFDALCFLTHNPAVFQPRALARTPALLWTDVTPAQLDQQADSYGHPVERSRLLRRVKSTLVERTFRHAALCVGWSEWARRSFVTDYRVAEARTAVLPPGVDLTLWKRAPRKTETGPARLLFVGGDFERKGGRLLLDVYRQALRERCTLDLVTRADIPDEPGVRVHRGLTPRSPELIELYQKASAFVLPTLGDCYSIASLEAMATGLPVVVSAIGGIPEIIEDGKSGYLIAPRDGTALRSALDELLRDPERRLALGERARDRVEARFDAEKTAKELLQLLGELARPGRSRTSD